MNTLHTLSIAGRPCWVSLPQDLPDGERLPAVYMVAEDDFPAQHDEILSVLKPALQNGTCGPFLWVAFSSQDWNADFSPWEVPALSGKAPPFTGKASDTKSWLLDACMPHIAANFPALTGAENQTILGYSLGGLFALWTAYESQVFLRCGSCSGSLWFDGWLPYMQAHHLPQGSHVYLSLGDREGNARNPRMAAVASVSEQAVALLQTDEGVAESTFAWQPGGHFTDVNKRLADALLWLLRENS